MIGQWIPNGNWLGIARDIKKIYFTFKTRQKMVTKFGQFKKRKCREGSQLSKLPRLCYHFLSSFENKNNFLISLVILCPSPAGIHWPINFTKKIDVPVYFQQQKKTTSLNRDIHPGDSWPYISSCVQVCINWH